MGRSHLATRGERRRKSRGGEIEIGNGGRVIKAKKSHAILGINHKHRVEAWSTALVKRVMLL